MKIVVSTSGDSLDSAVECTKLGAYGYLPKPYELDRLIETLKDAYQHRLERKFEHDRERLESLLADAVGESPLGILRRLRSIDTDER